jgi:hypothetical protein
MKGGGVIDRRGKRLENRKEDVPTLSLLFPVSHDNNIFAKELA